MIVGIVNEPVVRKHNALCASITSMVIDIAFRPCSPLGRRKLPIVVVVSASTDAFTGAYFVQIAFLAIPSRITRPCFRYEVRWQMSKLMDVSRHLFL